MHIRLPLLFALLAAFTLLGSKACIESRCIEDFECPVGEICVVSVGLCRIPECISDDGCEAGQICTDLYCVDGCRSSKSCKSGQKCSRNESICVVPECTSDDECETGQVCDDFRCVSGCRTDDDCASDEECLEKGCVPITVECDCEKAPAFCAEDLNPSAATSGEEICVPDSFRNGVALFFGSAGCSHCRNFFKSFMAISDDLKSDGEKPELVFVQLKKVEKTPDDFAVFMKGKNTHAVQDTDDLGIWDAYKTDWYYLAVIDRNGCFVELFGPLSDAKLEEGLADEIKETWREAMHAECKEPAR